MSELRTEARLLLQTVEDRLMEWRSLIPATDPTAHTTDPTAHTTDPTAYTTDPSGPTGSTARVTDPAGSPADHPSADHAEHQGTAGCPLCTVLAVVRGERPELAAALLDGAVTALQLVRGLVPESEQSDQPDPDDAAADPPTPLAPAPEPALPVAARRPPPERIRIT